MRIVLPVDDQHMDTTVCPSFGRCPYYLIYDCGKDQGEFLENTASRSAGGAGVRAAQIVVDTGVKVALTPRLGQNAADVLLAADMKLYKTDGPSVRDNIAAFKDGQLPELTQIHAGFHGHK